MVIPKAEQLLLASTSSSIASLRLQGTYGNAYDILVVIIRAERHWHVQIASSLLHPCHEKGLSSPKYR